MSLPLQTSSMRNARSLRFACVTHFSTTLLQRECKLSCTELEVKAERRKTLPGKLVLGEDENLALQLKYDATLVFRVAMFKHVLNDVVAILVLNESFGVSVQFLENRSRLFLNTVFQYSLNHAAAVRVRGQMIDLAQKTASKQNSIDQPTRSPSYRQHSQQLTCLRTSLTIKSIHLGSQHSIHFWMT